MPAARTILSLGLLMLTPPTLLVAQPAGSRDKHAGHAARSQAEPGDESHAGHVHFSIRSAKSGKWSDPATWRPGRVPGEGDRVLVSRSTTVEYDAKCREVIRLIQVVGTLSFVRDRDTELNVGIVTVQHSGECSEDGFACEFEGADAGPKAADGEWPSLLVGTPASPIPAEHTARIRLHYLPGMDRNDAPAIACCSGRMEIHGAPMSRTWVKLGSDVEPGETTVVLTEPVTGWRVGDEVIVTGSRRRGFGSFRPGTRRGQEPQTERRTITGIDGRTITLDERLEYEHSGSGEFRSEVANLSRNVIIESADPAGVRGHTVYHRFSRGGISYARFAHLGKEGVLGRYAIHYHLVGGTMRGSSVRGAAIVDSQNRWITIHGTNYLVVRDCVGYQSVGHGFFLEDGTETCNLLDRNLGVHAYGARRLPEQALPFDPNDGAAFWWANGLNTLVRNVAVENDRYGFRYDMQKTRRFDSRLPVLQPDGKEKLVDVRTLPVWRFEDNEAHGNFAGMVVAANGGRQPDVPIRDERTLRRIRELDWTGPDARHPHVIRGLKIWEAHYAFRPHSPNMLIEDFRIHRAAYGVYRPAFDNHVYRNVHISETGPEPFNRGMDDASAQNGSITVDGLIVDNLRGGNQRHPFVHMTDNNLTGRAECHFRNVTVQSREGRRPLFNRGGSVRVDPFVERGVPYYVHDYFGKGRHAKIVSTKAQDLLADGTAYEHRPPLTGDESVAAEVQNVEWPQLLDPVDDLPPATIITSVRRDGGRLVVAGVSHDNGRIVSVTVNGRTAKVLSAAAGVVDWQIEFPSAGVTQLTAYAGDEAGNVEKLAHTWRLTTQSSTAVLRGHPRDSTNRQ